MEQLKKPSKPARIVKQLNGDWHISWYNHNSKRIRSKFGLNYIKNLSLRQLWADRILNYINYKAETLESLASERDVPSVMIPPAYERHPTFVQLEETQTIEDTRIDERTRKEEETTTRKNSEQTNLLSPTFFSYLNSFILMKEAQNIKTTKFKTLLSLLRKMAESENKEDYEFEELDKNWAMRFRTYSISEPRKHSINYLSKNLSMIRQVLKEAEVEDDIAVNPKYKSKAYKLKEVPTDEIALSMRDIMKISELDLTYCSPGINLVRDNFIIGCLTGLRYMDWHVKMIHRQQMWDGKKRRNVLKIITGKTNEVVIIPLNPLAERILEKYNWELPTISNQKTNEYLKRIGELAKLNRVEQLRRSEAGKIVIVNKKLYEEISTHTARKTFVTVALFEMKLPPQLVMKITGHKSERQLFEYARIGKEQAAKLMARAMEDFYKE